MYRIISDEEFTLLKSKTDLKMSDLEWVLWERTSIVNYLNNISMSYRLKLANLQSVGKEWEIYIALKTIDEIIKWINSLKEEIENIKKQEEEKKK